MRGWRRRFLQRGADIIYSAIPRHLPDADQLSRARIVAHRGHTGLPGEAPENTLEAFDQCRQLGVFGIEFDIQWTRDGVPVVLHDRDTERVFGAPGQVLEDTDFDVLRAHHPRIPTLVEVISRYRGSLHLMIELKTDTLRARHGATLAGLLRDLEPEAEYHLLSLVPAAFELLHGFDPGVYMAVAETNTREILAVMSRHSITRIAGHYLLIDPAMRRRFAHTGIRYGTGMLPAPNVLRRELLMGSHWQFTNHGATLVHALHGMRQRRSLETLPVAQKNNIS